MLHGHKSPGTLVAEIKMSRRSHEGAFLLVEGRDDIRFWKSRCHATCELIDGEGKPNVIGGIQQLDTEQFPGALAVVDTDYDLPTRPRVESGNLLYTDAHDLECLLCRSSALDRVLAEHGALAKIQQFELAGVDVRTALLERTLVFGRLRWAASHARPAIALREIAVQRFVDENTWAVDAEKLLRQAAPNVRAIEGRLAQLPEADPWYIARGHDMVQILRIGLRRVLGDLPARIKANDIAGFLRVGMSPEALRGTGLGAGLHSWQAANQPYSILAD